MEVSDRGSVTAKKSILNDAKKTWSGHPYLKPDETNSSQRYAMVVINNWSQNMNWQDLSRCAGLGAVIGTTAEWAWFGDTSSLGRVVLQDMVKMFKWDLMNQNLSSCQWGGMVGSDLKETWDLRATEVIWLRGTDGRTELWIGKKDCMCSGK